MESKLKILVNYHKEDRLPASDYFLPIHVGKALSKLNLGIIGDDTGVNISGKNPNYCELTGHYWAWKNLENIEYIGLCHYRRYFDFTGKSRGRVIRNITFDEYVKINDKYNSEEIVKYFDNFDIILTQPMSYPYSLKHDYCYNHIYQDFMILEGVIKKYYSDYYEVFMDEMYYGNKLSHFNMFITKFDIFKDYSQWIFGVLDKVEKEIHVSEYTFQKRVFGYMSERLLQVYCKKNKLKIKYLPVFFIDDVNSKKETWVQYYLKNFKKELLWNIIKIKF